jgi:hypothetical protein
LLVHARLRKKRRHVALVILPLVVVFAMSSAWAAVTGHLPEVSTLWRWAFAPAARSAVQGGRGQSAAPSEDAAAPSAQAEATSEPIAPEAPIASIDAPHDAITPSPTPAAPSHARHAAPSVSPKRTPPEAATDAEESLFADAQRAHFVAKDPQAALRGWDAYLAAYPSGRFALEARYNRALTLVRLGRGAEARAALAPFASGATGGYRQQEARALLDVVDGGE